MLFYVQEPLTGLDASTAQTFVQLLKSYAASHDKIVIMTVHQPSSKLFFSFDSLLLMCEGQVHSIQVQHLRMELNNSDHTHRNLFTLRN